MTHKSTSPPTTDSFHKPQIVNLLFDELGQAVLKIHHERFRGVILEDTTPYETNQPITHPTTLLDILSYNCILQELTQERMQVVTPTDVVHYWEKIPERDVTFAATSALAIFPNQHPAYRYLQETVLKSFGKTATTIPLWAMDFKPIRTNSAVGFTLQRTELSRLEEAPYLTRDIVKMYYKPGTRNMVVARNDQEGVEILVPLDRSGSNMVIRNMDKYISCRDGGFFDPSASWRVQIVKK